MKYFAGLDVSLDETAVCVVSEEGVIVREGKAESDPGSLVDWLSDSGVELQRVGLEAGPLSPWLYEGLRAGGLPAVCIEMGPYTASRSLVILGWIATAVMGVAALWMFIPS